MLQSKHKPLHGYEVNHAREKLISLFGKTILTEKLISVVFKDLSFDVENRVSI